MMIPWMALCVNRVFEIFLTRPFGVRVDGAAPRGLWPPVGGRLCRRVVKEKVLRIDRPAAGGFLSLTGPLAPRVVVAASPQIIKRGRGWRRRLCRRVASLRSGGDSACGAEGDGLPSRAMLMKSALRDLLSVSYDMKTILLTGSLRSPPPIRLRRTSPYSGGRIKHRETFSS